MEALQENKRYLPGVPLPATIRFESELKTAVRHADVIILAIPSHAFETIIHAIQPYVQDAQILLSTAKGLTQQGGFMHAVAQHLLPKTRYALLSGPSFAKEVAHHLPTSVIIASQDAACAQYLSATISKNFFRTYTSDDLIGVQLGGAIKNVLAVAVGISDGLGFGANARAALITRGLHEMGQLGHAVGAHTKTFMGLSGLGDLLLTCTDDQSRNRRLGLAIGRGETLKQAQENIGQVIESIHTSALVRILSQRHHIEMPIAEQVYQILYHDLSPSIAVKNLFSRSLTAEAYSS